MTSYLLRSSTAGPQNIIMLCDTVRTYTRCPENRQQRFTKHLTMTLRTVEEEKLWLPSVHTTPPPLHELLLIKAANVGNWLIFIFRATLLGRTMSSVICNVGCASPRSLDLTRFPCCGGLIEYSAVKWVKNYSWIWCQVLAVLLAYEPYSIDCFQLNGRLSGYL